MSLAYSRLERCYLQLETTYGIVPALTNVGNVAKENFCRHTAVSLQGSAASIVRPDKTGMRSIVKGSVYQGRRGGRWNMSFSLAAQKADMSVVPLSDPLFACIFGQSGVPTGGPPRTSIEYTRVAGDDVDKSFTLYQYRRPGSLSQKVAHGCVVQQASFNLGGDVAMASFAGEAQAVLETQNYRNCTVANNRAVELGGLLTPVQYAIASATNASPVSFGATILLPPGPGVPPLNSYVWISGHTGAWAACNGIHKVTVSAGGNFGIAVDSTNFGAWAGQTPQCCGVGIPEEPAGPYPEDMGSSLGFVGSIVMDGNPVANMRNLTIGVVTGAGLVHDAYGTYFATAPEGGERRITANFTLDEDDTAATMNLMEAASNKKYMNIVATTGNVAGNKWKFTLNNVTLDMPTVTDEGVRFSLSFPDSPAAMNDLTTPEFAIQIT